MKDNEWISKIKTVSKVILGELAYNIANSKLE
jgi:hypothetical protein